MPRLRTDTRTAMLVPTPSDHPPGAASGRWPGVAAPHGAWNGWCSVAEALDAGEISLPVGAVGAYLFRIAPSVDLVPAIAPTRLLHIGGMGPSGSLFQRIGNFVAGAMGAGGPGPQSSSGLRFGLLRNSGHWPITVRDLEVAYLVVPRKDAHCIDAFCWHWYWYTYSTLACFPSLASGWPYPACDRASRLSCSHGRTGHHAGFPTPPLP